jgi:ubiquinone/menaquinone biosynthesis C-methylase UbiE
MKKGVLSLEYREKRKKRAERYRLLRRAEEVLKVIRAYKGDKIDSVLDIGTADAAMLDMLDKTLSIKTPVGLDFSIELLKTNTNPKLNLLGGDAAKLPFKGGSFDVVVATAVIEHVPEPGEMIDECNRVLKRGGICVLTTPDPLFERIATKIGHLEKGQHVKTFKLSELSSLLESRGFKVLRAEKFMMSPVGFPHEIKIEKIMKAGKLNFLLLNQLIVGQKL